MHKAHTAGKLDRDGIDEIMCEEKANQREKVTISSDRLKGKIPGSYNEQQLKEYIVKAVEFYHRYLYAKNHKLAAAKEMRNAKLKLEQARNASANWIG